MLALRTLVACGLMIAGISSVGAETAPYAGMQNRALKALSEQQLEDLRAGRGMGLALAAELNSYPGPMLLRRRRAAARCPPGVVCGRPMPSALITGTLSLGAILTVLGFVFA